MEEVEAVGHHRTGIPMGRLKVKAKDVGRVVVVVEGALVQTTVVESHSRAGKHDGAGFCAERNKSHTPTPRNGVMRRRT